MLTAIIGSAGFIVLSDMVVDIDDVIVLTANCHKEQGPTFPIYEEVTQAA